MISTKCLARATWLPSTQTKQALGITEQGGGPWTESYDTHSSGEEVHSSQEEGSTKGTTTEQPVRTGGNLEAETPMPSFPENYK